MLVQGKEVKLFRKWRTKELKIIKIHRRSVELIVIFFTQVLHYTLV